MDSALTRQPFTPTRAKSAGPYRPHRNPMEDADSSSTRKRPRLDSGNRVYRSMSADPTGAAPPNIEAALTPSKVTINVREPLGNNSSSGCSSQANGTSSTQVGRVGSDKSADRPEDSPAMDISSPKVISVSSSPSHSPEIEIAEVEDINDDPGETRWRPLESTAIAASIQDAKDVQMALLDQFPLLTQQNLRKTISLIATALGKNDVNDGDLFNSLATWIESYLQTTETLVSKWWDMIQDEREFWDDMPSLIEALVHRSNARPGSLKISYSRSGDQPTGRNPLQYFLVAFTSLTLRMIRIDHQTLTRRYNENSISSDLVSDRYLHALHAIMAWFPFWKNLVDASTYDSKETISAIVDKFMDPLEHGINILSSIAKESLDRSIRVPALVHKFFTQIAVLGRLMQHHHTYQRQMTEDNEEMTFALQELTNQAYELFLHIDARLQHFIKKQISVLSIDTCQGFVTNTSTLLRFAVFLDEQLLKAVTHEKTLPIHGLGTEDISCLVELAWKFETLKKCIFDGRMEIRIQGVDIMQQELILVYTKYIDSNPAHKSHPIPQYLADFMLLNKLVNYFVGVDSHPQLIQRCGNIIGFLLVTNRYTEAESDIIWNAVTRSQDPRFIDMILAMLPSIFGVAQYPVLLYLTKKLNETPISTFDSEMIGYTRGLLEALRRQWRHQPTNSKMELPPFHLCIRLVRQAVVEESFDTFRKRAMYNFASQEIGCLWQFGPSDIDRISMYRECIQDILEKNDSATSSVSAMNALLSQDPEKELSFLMQEWDIAYLVIEEFAHTIKVEGSAKTPPMILQERLEPRLQLIQNVIHCIPDTIRPEVRARLWEYGVGSEALNFQTREIVWLAILGVLRKSSDRNSFLDHCVREHLPRLQPCFYTPGALQFALDVCNYHFRSTISRPQDDTKQETTAEDLLWHISLTALPCTVERKAISSLVTLYLDAPENTRRTRAAIEAIHIGVIERCVRQLTSAASSLKSFSDGTSSGEDEPMVIVAPENEIEKHQLWFSRSLTILKDFIWGVRSRPRYSPILQAEPPLPLESRLTKGDLIKIRYQPFGVGATGEMRTIQVGNLEIMQEFVLRLKFLTGFSKLTLITGGHKLDLGSNGNSTLRDLKLDQKGLLLVKKDPDAGISPDLSPISGLRPVEAEVLTHFSKLYPLLAMEEKLAKEMFEFLVLFPPHNSIVALVCSEDTPLDAMFPPLAPFKVLYSVHAIKQYITSRTPNAPYTTEFAIHSIRSLTAALTTLNLNIGPEGPEVDTTLAATILECLTHFLKEPSSFTGAEDLFVNTSILFKRLLSMVKASLILEGSTDADLLASLSFGAILKISLYVESFWNEFKNADECTILLKRLILEEPNWHIRRRLGDYVKSICLELHMTPTAPAQELIPYLWKAITTILPYCLYYEETAQEFFELATTVFQCIDQTHQKRLNFALYIQDWSDVLLRYRHDEFVGRETIDWLVHGISSLLNLVFRCAEQMGKPVQIPDHLLERLFGTHLFPEIPDYYQDSLSESRVPNLHSTTRQELYSIILVLSKDVDSYQHLLMLVKDLLSQGEGSYSWSWGFAQILEDSHYDLNWNFERSKTIRSPTGYPGLRNLSNTCYMNSLFTQLFMNVKFRGFILGTNVADGTASQKLLQETQTLFGFMQDTVLKSVDSQGIADSLVTYDNTLVDVSVQMDVDEFYNLLFDRWEGQILLGADKKAFRRFYGGQIVQQIKSKECPHISERLEPFSAIQCDIQGKATLMDSLNAYVSGETMEGDNKYSCTSCGCYVDAVKRACFKDIPDNLIFHLKRFDYDVLTGMRSKINDVFEFPYQINMAPYHVDYQKDPSAICVPDLFELVGVLVHSGTAESGHYYSYVRERPPNSASGYSWVEFNDVDVTKFDPNSIADQCFGGYIEAPNYSHRFQKNWNAYMLFYERMEPRAPNENPLPMTVGVPAKCQVPPEIERQVAISNAQFMRNYSLFDPAHAAFARQLLEQLRVVNGGICSENHVIEKEAIWLSLDYLEKILSRCKDCSDFGKMLGSLIKVIGSCARCCRLTLDWVKFHEYSLRNLLLRCPNPKVRKDFASMVVIALQHLKASDPYAYGFQVSHNGDLDSSEKELRASGMFPHLVTRLADLWPVLPAHSRGWDDYFSLLIDLASQGVHERHVLLNRSFLRGCLEILVVEHSRAFRLRSEVQHYAHYYRLAEKGRRFSLAKLAELLATLLEKVDLTIELAPTVHDRRFNLHGMSLTAYEDSFMQMGHDLPRTKVACVFLDKLLSSKCNPSATHKILRQMTLAEPQFGMLEVVKKTIISGISVEPADLAAPYLDAAITFCEATPTPDSAQDLIRYIAAEINTIAEQGGEEHLKFFSQARRMVNLRDGFETGFFNRAVLRMVPQWAPVLLNYPDERVRTSTVDLLKHLVFAHDISTMDDEEHADLIETAARDLQVACIRRCTHLVHEQKQIGSKTVEQIMQVIRYCLAHYYTSDDDQRPVAEADSVLAALDLLTVVDVDETVSDTWNNASDELASDSEDEFLTTSP